MIRIRLHAAAVLAAWVCCPGATALAASTVTGARAADTTAPARAAAAVAPYEDVVRLILEEALAEGRAYERLEELTRIAPHRLAGSPGYAAAAAWAHRIMKEDGLQDVRLQAVEVPHWVRGDVGLVRIVEPVELAGRELPMLALGGSVPTPEQGITAEVVMVESLEEAATLGDTATGKIVLFNGLFDPRRFRTFEAYGAAVRQRVHGAREAARVGAVAALVRSISSARDDAPHTGGMRYAADVPAIPTAAISTNAADEIAALVAAGRKVVLHVRQDCRTLPDAVDHNVIGDYRGRERPEEILVVGGHLDCWDVGQGAHDDGGGCCQAIEAVRLLTSLGLRPRRTIRVVLFANEENGLRGARAYRNEHALEMPRHVLALESDSGVFTPRGFSTNANPEAMAILRAIGELLEMAGAGTIDPGGGGADIGPMRDDGVVLVGLRPDSQRYFDLHHSPNDTMAQVSHREINLGAGAMAALLYVVADLERTLPRNEPAEG